MALAEVVCIGETMAMVTPVHAERLELAREVAIHTGGSESDVAMYLAGLGHQVTWVSRLGDDPLGHRVCRQTWPPPAWAPRSSSLDKAAPTGVYFKDPRPEGTTTLVSFNVNFRPALWDPKEAVPRPRALAHRAGAVFVGLDEAQTLWGTHAPREVRDLLPGPPVLVVKDGRGGWAGRAGDPGRVRWDGGG